MNQFRRVLPWMLAALLVAFVAWKLHASHFDWAAFDRSWRTADLRLIFLAFLVICTNYILRAIRWSIFLKPAYKAAEKPPIAWWKLVGSQFIGFAGLAIFGRIGELIRPLLISRRTGLNFSSQIAVVTVERVFDLGAFAILFALNLLLSPNLQTLPYHEKFHAVGYAIAGLTLLVSGLILSVRLAGNAVAGALASIIGRFSPHAGQATADKVFAFRDGLDVIASFADFLALATISLVMWASIAVSYVLVMKAFPPPVHNLTISHILVLMGFSVVGSIVQLPGVGGGAQVGTISALTLLFGIPGELAISAGIIVWLVTTMSVIPVGLVYAKIEGISIRQVANRSEDEEIAILAGKV
jgi:uncharacterized protein (TIRG00374 family)